MKILVTGAQGQLGSDLCKLLSGQGQTVIAPGRDILDFLKPETISQQVQKHQADWVINCAAYTQVDQAEQEQDAAFTVNRDAVAELARAVKKTTGRLLHISTDFIFGGDQAVPYSEDADGNPRSIYGQSQWEGELAVRKIDTQALIVRTAWVYGVQGNNFVKTILRLAQQRKELHIVSDQWGTPSWTRDIARALLDLMEKSVTGIYHFTNEGESSWYDFSCAIIEDARAIGFELQVEKVIPISTDEYPTAAKRPAYSVLDKTKISSLLEYPIPHWRNSLTKMLKELRACPDCL